MKTKDIRICKKTSLHFKHKKSNFFYLIKDYRKKLYHQLSVGCLPGYKKLNSKKQKIKHAAELLGEKAADKVVEFFNTPETYYNQKSPMLYRIRKKHNLITSYLLLLTNIRDRNLYVRALKKNISFSFKKAKKKKGFFKHLKKLERFYTYSIKIENHPSLQCLYSIINLGPPRKEKYSEQMKRYFRLKKKYKVVFPRKRDKIFTERDTNRIFYKYIYNNRWKKGEVPRF